MNKLHSIRGYLREKRSIEDAVQEESTALMDDIASRQQQAAALRAQLEAKRFDGQAVISDPSYRATLKQAIEQFERKEGVGEDASFTQQPSLAEPVMPNRLTAPKLSGEVHVWTQSNHLANGFARLNGLEYRLRFRNYHYALDAQMAVSTRAWRNEVYDALVAPGMNGTTAGHDDLNERCPASALYPENDKRGERQAVVGDFLVLLAWRDQELAGVWLLRGTRSFHSDRITPTETGWTVAF
ncbi:hypothetical protein [Paracraurococcus lichenis]|uniref:Peptidoglycan binding-like domain-containing protein n=1 Tax=Paracraurococcus lichenis TaxID=3064888 RepID=A0ABT9E7Q7_9PROT|nr:hypothetical protein [Paracraurococcus sp. LOR1-02]MDO9711990.1 hypothetical protein [Paracraurococcus sp. LOR1-02]